MTYMHGDMNTNHQKKLKKKLKSFLYQIIGIPVRRCKQIVKEKIYSHKQQHIAHCNIK
jgi:hypothetical protein